MKRTIALLAAALIACLALAPALAEQEPAPLEAALEAFDAAYGELDGGSVAITHAYLLEAADRDALSEHGAALLGEGDACVYIIAEQRFDGFAIPGIMQICYRVSAAGEAALEADGLNRLDAYNWQAEYAGMAITDVTEDAQAYLTAAE